ncbi:MAG: hypothetical protein R3B84_13655 [Zavarzinella sp.]
MPIKFRCVYCDKLLGIATRKAGTTVDCPQCSNALIVPTPLPDSVDKDDETVKKLFEDDIDELLQEDPSEETPSLQAGGPKTTKPAVAPQPAPITAPLPVKESGEDLTISKSLAIVMMVLFALLLLGAFISGFFFARSGT